MKRLTLSLLLGLLALIAAAYSTTPDRAGADGHEWITDYNAGIEKAQAEKKPIFLEFRCMP
jgi:hypothetical protein